MVLLVVFCKNCLLTAIQYLLAALVFTLPARTTDRLDLNVLPLYVPDQNWQPLRDRLDLDLQARLERKLHANRVWSHLIKKRKMAVGVVDLSHPLSVRFARVNGDTMLYAASLPKIAILLAAFQAFEDGILHESPEILDDLINMIRYSNNKCATHMIDRLGFGEIEKVLTDPKCKLFDPEKGGGLWVGKRYARYGARHPDPIKGVVHGASVTQVCRFYYLLATGRLVNAYRCKQMLDILSDPELHHKFVHALDK
ncbi:MAG: hypothetical protein ACE5HO_21875, partial [bacterium]